MIRSAEICAVQNLHFTQVYSTALSTQKLFALAPVDKPQLATPLDKVGRIVVAEVANANHVLVVMPKKLSDSAARRAGFLTGRRQGDWIARSSRGRLPGIR